MRSWEARPGKGAERHPIVCEEKFVRREINVGSSVALALRVNMVG